MEGLIVSRKSGEAVTVDGSAEVHVEHVAGNRVTLRIVAPESTRILRAELAAIARASKSKADEKTKRV
jgi:carbon storage regulator CsrA